MYFICNAERIPCFAGSFSRPPTGAFKEKIMSEPTPAIETTPETKSGKLVRQILKWVVLGLLLLTCVMAAYRKFGG